MNLYKCNIYNCMKCLEVIIVEEDKLKYDIKDKLKILVF